MKSKQLTKVEIDAIFDRNYSELMKQCESLIRGARSTLEASDLLSFAYMKMLEKKPEKDSPIGWIMQVCRQQVGFQNAEIKRKGKSRFEVLSDKVVDIEFFQTMNVRTVYEEACDSDPLKGWREGMEEQEVEDRKNKIIQFLATDKRWAIFLVGKSIKELSQELKIREKELYKRRDAMREFANRMLKAKHVNTMGIKKPNYRLRKEFAGEVVKLTGGMVMDTNKIKPDEFASYVSCGFGHCFYNANLGEVRGEDTTEVTSVPAPPVAPEVLEDEEKEEQSEGVEAPPVAPEVLEDEEKEEPEVINTKGRKGSRGSSGSTGK